MCGRYALYGPRSRSRGEQEYFATLDSFPDRYNVAPTDVMPITILVDGVPQVVTARWGLIPPQCVDMKTGARKINAPAEKIGSWADYRAPYRSKQRCLVPACGFYEWEARPDGKYPYYFLSPEKTLLAFAGLWQLWKQPNGELLRSYTIVTVEPNDFVRRFHDRMPAVLEEADYGEWLRGDDPKALLKPCHNETLVNYPVSRKVNSPKADDPALIEPVA